MKRVCPLLALNGHFIISHLMSLSGGKAGHAVLHRTCLLLTQSGHRRPNLTARYCGGACTVGAAASRNVFCCEFSCDVAAVISIRVRTCKGRLSGSNLVVALRFGGAN